MDVQGYTLHVQNPERHHIAPFDDGKLDAFDEAWS
jgi:hypothetical protein